MHFGKKIINTHLLHLTLLVILLRLGPNQYLNNRWNQDNEVREIYLGSSSAYAQHNFHNNRADSHALIYRKNIDSMIINDTLNIFQDLYYHRNLNPPAQQRENFLAFHVSTESTQDQHRNVPDEANNALPPATSNLVNSVQAPDVDDASLSTEQASLSQTNPTSFDLSLNRDLSAEDLDFIEILLRDDLEPGVDQESSFASFEYGKLAAVHKKELQVPEDFYDFMSRNSPIPSRLLSEDDSASLASAEEEDDAGHKHSTKEEEEEKLAATSYNDNFTNSILEVLEDGCNLTAADSSSPQLSDSVASLFPEFFPDMVDGFSIDEESMFAQLDRLEKLSASEGTSENCTSEDAVSDLYPTMEDCWQDITTTLPLPVIGSTQQGASLSLLTRPSLAYSGISSSNYNLTSSQASVSENFSGVLLQNATLVPPSADVNGTFSYVPTTLGPSSIGCAVAASMATLTNDTDPVPDGGAIATYNSDFPELIYPNHTAVAAQGEYILSDLLLDDDFQLMDMAAPANYTTPTNAVGEQHVDTSSDSAVSLTSGRVPSISDCQDWVDSCSESSHHGEHGGSLIQMETSFPINQNPGIERGYSSDHGSGQYSNVHHTIAQKKYKLFGRKTTTNTEEIESGSNEYKPYASGPPPSREYLYIPAKQPNDELVGCPYGSVEGAAAAPHEPNYGMPSSLASAGNFAPYPQHNHSYHLPFINNNCLEKPIARDKGRLSRCDGEPSNRDEKKARALKLPISIHDIINLAIDEFNERLTKYDLTEAQHTLIRDIRRRGKNKVAAQNCRKRKMDQISTLQVDLDQLQSERMQLETEQSQMLHQRKYYEDKYAKLYQYVVQATNLRTDSMNSVPPSCDIPLPADCSTVDTDKGTDSSKGARTKKKFDKKSP